MKLGIVLSLLATLGCAAKKPPQATVNVALVAPRACLAGDGPAWTPESFCRNDGKEWHCYHIKASMKKGCETLEIAK